MLIARPFDRLDMFSYSMKLSFLTVSILFAHLGHSFISTPKYHTRFNNVHSRPSDTEHCDVSDRSYESEVSSSSSNLKHSILKNTAILVSCLTSSVLLRATSSAAADNVLLEKEVAVGSGTFDPMAASRFAAEIEKNRALNSDEFFVKFDNKSLGLGLTETGYKGFPVVTVSSIKYPLNNVNDKEFRVSIITIKIIKFSPKVTKFHQNLI